MSPRRMSQTLAIEDGRICCQSCRHAIGAAGSSWKPQAALSESPLAEAPGMSAAVRRKALLRQFCCPQCGALLDVEIAMPGDPYLADILQP